MKMKNMSKCFVADDTLARYGKLTRKIIRYAERLGIDRIYISVVMDNPDGTTEKARHLLVNQVSAPDDRQKADLLFAVWRHLEQLRRGG